MIHFQAMVLSALFYLTAMAHADPLFDWTSTNIQALSGGTHELGSSKRNLITIEHAHGWRYGDNFMFIDVIDRSDIGTEFYGEFYPRLSWSKMTGLQPSVSAFKDFSLVAGINTGNLPKSDPHKAYLFGGGISFNVPAMDYLQLDVQAFKSENVSTTGIQITPVWSVPFQIGSLHFKFRGFADWQSKKATGGEHTLLTQPQLLLDVGQLANHPNQFYAGIEYSYWRNKFGIDGVTEKIAQAMLMFTF
ncbi:MAG: DUF5020 family protein [Gammaproteobacteria bacterium]|nr:DUF5020 family protein [Gammaproteobacteria bacterium]MDH5592165.1 DUF5020 family protein [Gammaproteobacteria bacterium]